MKRLINSVSITLLLASAIPAVAQYLEQPGADFYRMPDRVAHAPWHQSGGRYSYRVRVQRQVTPQAYYIRIDTGGRDTDAVQLKVEGNSLLIGSNRSVQNEQRSDRGGYRFSRFSTGFNQRIRLPRDADMANMQRHQEGGLITLTIPRRRQMFPDHQGHGYWR